MKTTNIPTAFMIALVMVVFSPSATAVPTIFVEDFEDDTPGQNPAETGYTFNLAGPASVSQVEASGGRGGGQYYRWQDTTVDSVPRFDWDSDLCSGVTSMTMWINTAYTNYNDATVFWGIHDKGQTSGVGQGAQYRGFGLNINTNVLKLTSNGDGSIVTSDVGSVSANTWYEATFTNINCADASVSVSVTGVGSTSVNDAGSWAKIDRLSMTQYNSQPTFAREMKIDDITIDSLDFPASFVDSMAFASPVDDLQITNDGLGFVFVLHRDSTVGKYTANTASFSQVASVSACSPSITGFAGTTDPPHLTEFSITPTDRVFVICEASGDDTIIGYTQDLNTVLTTRAYGITNTPNQIAAAEVDSSFSVGVLQVDSTQDTVRKWTGLNLLADPSTTFCGTASAADASTDRNNELGSTLWTVNDVCGVEGYPSDGPGSATIVSSVVGTSIAARGDFVYVSDAIGNTLKRLIAGGGTLTQTHSVSFDYGSIRVSWDGRYIVAGKGDQAWLLNATDLTELADWSLSAGNTVNSCDMDANNNYIWCGGETPGLTGFINTLNAFPYTVSEAGDGNATTPNPTIDEDLFTPSGTVGGTPGTGVGSDNTGSITPTQPTSTFFGIDIETMGNDVVGDAGLWYLILGMAIIAGLAAAGTAAGWRYDVPLAGGVGGGVLGFLGVVSLGWIPVWFVLFIVLIGVGFLVLRFRTGGE